MTHKIGFDLDLNKLPDGRFKDVLNYLEKINFTSKVPCTVVNGYPIPFDPNYKNIGVWLSAGTDSTFLLYILAKIISELKCDTKIYPMTVVRYWEHTAWSEEAKRKIYFYIRDLFPDIIQEQQWGFLPTAMEFTPLQNLKLRPNELQTFKFLVENNANADIYFFTSYSFYLAKRLKIDAMYNGTTTNPTTINVNEAPEFRNANELREDSANNLLFKQEYITDIIVKNYFMNVTPFNLIEKNWIVAQYDNFGLQELFDMTRSCVESDNPKVGCRRPKCFHCEERFWAIDNKGLFLEDYHKSA